MRVGDRVFLRVDPDRQGTVVRLYAYSALTVLKWADVEWDKPTMKQFGGMSSVSVSDLELV